MSWEGLRETTTKQQLYLYPTLIYMIQKILDKIWKEYKLPIITIGGLKDRAALLEK